MEEKKLRDAFEHLNPSEQEKREMFYRIQNAGRRKKGRTMRVGVAAALIALIVAVSGVGIDAATGGKVMQTIREVCGWGGTTKEIVENTESIRQKGVEVYAPEIFALDESSIVFGGQGGIIVYDREKEQIAGTIDVQAIDCIYFNSENKKTHVLKKGDAVYLFNAENEKPVGKYYRYDLKQEDGVELAVSDSGEQPEELEKLYREWEEHDKQYTGTFEEFQNAEFIENPDKENVVMYSERSVFWKDSEGRGYVSCLLLDSKDQYVIYSAELTLSSAKVPVPREVLNFASTSEDQSVKESGTEVQEETLPEYQYTGDDPVEQAIYEYLKGDTSYWMPEENAVQIPMLTVISREKKGEETLIFASYQIFGYVKTGQILENVSGGGTEACFHLVQSGDEYRVTEVEMAEDGGMYEESLREMTKDYPGVYEKFRKHSEELTEEKYQKWICENVSAYVRKNHLDIRYYKDYGWDPVPIEQ